MGIKIAKEMLDDIRSHARRAYPDECCGMLLGGVNEGSKVVKKVVALENLRTHPEHAQKILPLERPGTETARNRFLIDPGGQMQVERQARQAGLEVLGYYHSHPDHAARPSNYDREYAWPWYSYVILSVERGEPGDLTSWVLADDRSQFNPERVEVVNS